jgi:adenylate kinase
VVHGLHNEGRLRIVLLGPPGAGKGTQSVVLSREYEVVHISAGDILRDAVKSGSQTGLAAAAFMSKGELVPDRIVTAMIIERMGKGDAENGFILDGFPRTINQARELDEAMRKMPSKIDTVIYFETSSKTAIDRLSGRRVCRSCGFNYHIRNIPPKKEGVCDKCGGLLFQRPDDKEETIINRLEVYEAETKPLIDYYAKQGILRKVSGDLGVDDLFGVVSRIFADEKLA